MVIKKTVDEGQVEIKNAKLSDDELLKFLEINKGDPVEIDCRKNNKCKGYVVFENKTLFNVEIVFIDSDEVWAKKKTIKIRPLDKTQIRLEGFYEEGRRELKSIKYLVTYKENNRTIEKILKISFKKEIR